MKNLQNITPSNLQYQICKGSHNQKVLQVTEQKNSRKKQLLAAKLKAPLLKSTEHLKSTFQKS